MSSSLLLTVISSFNISSRYLVLHQDNMTQMKIFFILLSSLPDNASVVKLELLQFFILIFKRIVLYLINMLLKTKRVTVILALYCSPCKNHTKLFMYQIIQFYFGVINRNNFLVHWITLSLNLLILKMMR